MSTPYYLLAHRVLPIRASVDPAGLWDALSGPGWSMWLAQMGAQLGTSMRGVGVEGVTTGHAVQVRGGVEMLAVYFPPPPGPGEPYYAVLARTARGARPRTFVFERGIDDDGPPRVVMAEWQSEGAGDMMRIRYDVSADASLEACLARTAAEMQRAPAPRPPATPHGSGGAGWRLFAMIAVAIAAVVGAGALAFSVLVRM